MLDSGEAKGFVVHLPYRVCCLGWQWQSYCTGQFAALGGSGSHIAQDSLLPWVAVAVILHRTVCCLGWQWQSYCTGQFAALDGSGSHIAQDSLLPWVAVAVILHRTVCN